MNIFTVSLSPPPVVVVNSAHGVRARNGHPAFGVVFCSGGGAGGKGGGEGGIGAVDRAAGVRGVVLLFCRVSARAGCVCMYVCMCVYVCGQKRREAGGERARAKPTRWFLVRRGALSPPPPPRLAFVWCVCSAAGERPPLFSQGCAISSASNASQAARSRRLAASCSCGKKMPVSQSRSAGVMLLTARATATR